MRLYILALTLISCASLSAYGEDLAVGARVYVKSDAKATVGGEYIDVDAIPYPAEVEKIDGDWLWLGEVRVLRSDVFDANEAIADLTEAIEKDLDASYSYSLRALVWHSEGDFAKAVEDNTKALALDPSDETTLYNRGSAYAKMKDFERAIEDYSAAIKLDPVDYRFVGARGAAFYLLKQYEKAIKDLSEAIRLAPEFSLTFQTLAWLRATCPDERFRNGREAVRLATKSAELTKWKSPSSLSTLAAAHAEVGDFAKAIAWQEKAIGLSSNESNKSRYRSRLALYRAGKPFRDEEPAEL